MPYLGRMPTLHVTPVTPGRRMAPPTPAVRYMPDVNMGPPIPVTRPVHMPGGSLRTPVSGPHGVARGRCVNGRRRIGRGRGIRRRRNIRIGRRRYVRRRPNVAGMPPVLGTPLVTETPVIDRIGGVPMIIRVIPAVPLMVAPLATSGASLAGVTGSQQKQESDQSKELRTNPHGTFPQIPARAILKPDPAPPRERTAPGARRAGYGRAGYAGSRNRPDAKNGMANSRHAAFSRRSQAAAAVFRGAGPRPGHGGDGGDAGDGDSSRCWRSLCCTTPGADRGCRPMQV